MGYTRENDCVGCPQGCVHCGRGRDYKAYFCDGCGEYFRSMSADVAYEHDKGIYCEECYKKLFTSKICDDMDESKCARCEYEAEELYHVDGEWICEQCLLDGADKFDLEAEEFE